MISDMSLRFSPDEIFSSKEIISPSDRSAPPQTIPGDSMKNTPYPMPEALQSFISSRHFLCSSFSGIEFLAVPMKDR